MNRRGNYLNSEIHTPPESSALSAELFLPTWIMSYIYIKTLTEVMFAIYFHWEI